MDKTYKLFRAYTVTAIIIMCVLLFVTGTMTAKYKSETTVFGYEHPVIQVFRSGEKTVINVSGKIVNVREETVKKYLFTAGRLILSPFGNILEAADSILQPQS